MHFCTPKPNPPWKTYNNTSMNIHLVFVPNWTVLNSTHFLLLSLILDHHYPLDFFHGIFHQSSQGTLIVLASLLASSALFSRPEKRRRLMDRFWLGSRQNVGWRHFMIFYRYKRKFQIKQKWYVQLNFWKSTEKTSQSMYSYWNTLKELERRWITMEQVRMVKILYREHLSLSLSSLDSASMIQCFWWNLYYEPWPTTYDSSIWMTFRRSEDEAYQVLPSSDREQLHVNMVVWMCR